MWSNGASSLRSVWLRRGLVRVRPAGADSFAGGVRGSTLRTSGAPRKPTSAREVGDAPLPLRLVYTYRSPNVSLWKSAGGDDPKGGVPVWWPLTLLFGLNAAVFGAWVWVPPGQDADALRRAGQTYMGVLNWKPEQTALADNHVDFMERHFTVSVENLVEGRLHTLITAGFSQRDLPHLGGNMFALGLFGYRSCSALGPVPFLGLYLAGAFVCSSASVMKNLYHGRTTPHLTRAEMRATTRSILRSIDKEARHNETSQSAMFSWLPFGNEKASVWEDSPTVKEGGKETMPNSDLNVFQRIGRLMAETGLHSASVVRNFVSGTKGTEERNTVLEMIKDRIPEVKDATNGEENPSWWESFRQRKHIHALELAAAEERRRAALIKLAQELVFQCYVAPRDRPSLGASGAIMAITNGSVLLFPRDLVVKGGVNIPLPAAAALYTASDIFGVVYPEAVDPVDHIGHLAGAGAGLLYVWARWTFLRGGAGTLPIVMHGRKIVENWMKAFPRN